MSVDVRNFRRVVGAAATVTAIVQTATAVVALRRGRRDYAEDPRYTEFLEGDSTAVVVGKVFLTQGLSQLLVSAPVQLAAASRLPRTARRWLFPRRDRRHMLTGAVVEALADRQKTAYQQRGDDKPDVLVTQHPADLHTRGQTTCIASSRSPEPSKRPIEPAGSAVVM